MSIFDRRRRSKKSLDEKEEFLIQAQAEVDAREPRVNALWAWAIARRVANGIGGDFEFELSQLRRFGGAGS